MIWETSSEGPHEALFLRPSPAMPKKRNQKSEDVTSAKTAKLEPQEKAAVSKEDEKATYRTCTRCKKKEPAEDFPTGLGMPDYCDGLCQLCSQKMQLHYNHGKSLEEMDKESEREEEYLAAYDDDGVREYLKDFGLERGYTPEALIAWHKAVIVKLEDNPSEVVNCESQHVWYDDEFDLECEDCRLSSEELDYY